jgi:multicomponent Na+:H+ antiporter subunit C
MTIVTLAVSSLLFAFGTYLLLQRQLTRIIIGLSLLSHGVNLLLLLGGRRGTPPVIGDTTAGIADPLPQALVLTAIVITFGLSAFLLALAVRSWFLTGSDEVEDDIEDRRIAKLDRVPEPVEASEDMHEDVGS